MRKIVGLGTVNTLQLIEEAFSHRRMPGLFPVSEQMAPHEYDDVISFWGIPWSAVTGSQLQEHFETIFWWTPEAFCYYLPGILSAGIRENKPWLIVNNSLIDMLDRSPDPSSWDDFFIARWAQLTAKECEATQAWLLWVASLDNGSYWEGSLSRAFDTLELLKQRTRA
ncbi:MAG TPA: DUF6714 family protein [Thermoanaerobaculia bacterium]|jgi:hypothetical protein|nr:DUF6714 family protein [Thermoanaerobaculia bacterium]